MIFLKILLAKLITGRSYGLMEKTLALGSELGLYCCFLASSRTLGNLRDLSEPPCHYL